MCCARILTFHLLILVITGSADGLSISPHQVNVHGHEKGSIILSISYTQSGQPDFIEIIWERGTSPSILVICTKNSNGIHHLPADGYQRRMHIVPENGSLIINQLEKNDAGKYRVKVDNSAGSASAEFVVTVQESDIQGVFHSTPNLQSPSHCERPCNSTSVNISSWAWIVLGSRLSSFFIVQVFFICLVYFC